MREHSDLLHNEELHYLYKSYSTVTLMK